MKVRGKIFIALFLIFSLVVLSANLYAKERRGAKLIVTKKDGQQIRGELITVKPNSLLLLDTEGKDVSIDVADIKVIRIVKKSKALLGGSIGFGVGALGAGLALAAASAFSSVETGRAILGCAIYVSVVAIPGALIGSIFGKDKTIVIRGRSDSEIKTELEKLRKKARIRDYK